MNNVSSKTAFLVLGGAVLFLIFVYLAVFSGAWRQQENHIAILRALPRVLLTSEAVRIDEQTYLAKDGRSFIRAMENQGFTNVDKLGSGYVFEKDGHDYISISRMYSSHFQIFPYPSTGGQVVENLFSYADGSGNIYTIDPAGMTIEYDPVSIAESSSGMYSGGEYVKKEITADQYSAIAALLQNAADNTAIHIENRIKGSGALTIKDQTKTRNFILDPRATGKTEIEQALRKLLGGR